MIIQKFLNQENAKIRNSFVFLKHTTNIQKSNSNLYNTLIHVFEVSNGNFILL